MQTVVLVISLASVSSRKDYLAHWIVIGLEGAGVRLLFVCAYATPRAAQWASRMYLHTVQSADEVQGEPS